MADKPDTKRPSRSGRSPSPAEAAGSEAALKRGTGSPRRKATSSSPSKSGGSPARKSRSSSPSPARSVTGSPSRRRRKTGPPSSPRSKSPKSSSPRLSSRSPRATVSGSKRASPTGKLGKRFKSRINAAILRDRERRSRIYQWFKGLAGQKGSPRGGSSPRLRHSGRSKASPGFMSPFKSGSVRLSRTGSPSRSTREPAPSRSKYGSGTLLALVVVAFVVAVIILAAGRYLRNHAASTLHQCVGETCHRYEELLSNAMDPEAHPCDDFYAHVCGTWIKTARKPVYEVNWEWFLVEIAKRTADLNPLVGANQRPVDKAVTYIKACLSPLERDNMPEPVFLTIDVTIMEGPRTLLLSIGKQFLSTYYKISEHVTHNHIKEHFRVSYESLAPTNETRMNHLFNHFITMMRFMDNHMPVTDSGNSSGDPATFLEWTPSVPESRWDTQTRRFLNSPLRNLTGWFVDRVGGFRAIFELHQAFGEKKMADFVGFFAVQTLVGFTNIHLLESFYKASDIAIEEQRKACITTAYQTFAYAIDSFLQEGMKGAQQDVGTLVNWTMAAFGRLLESRDDSSVLVGHLEPAPQRSNLNQAFSILNSSSRMSVDNIYAAFPEMVLDAPLSDSINVSAYMQAQVSKSGQPSQTLYAGYQALDATVFSGFRINPQLLAFPWYEPDAHVGVLLGGLGARLAAVTFYDYVERTGTNSTLYSENQDCLSPASNVSVGADVDADLQGAVAAAAVVADVYKEVARKKDPKWTGREAPPPWTSERMPFVFFCWLNCGDSERGPMMCNAPMMHNWDFARVFACPEEAPMNPSIKCRMRL
ncbi:uncharacterized protein LOC142772254 [Rhipicephalus microplus]|uniref:uncharacterized protein LOC142772254 n=1 Tax=Rhipicephalus microplus TaxID=6941 RepID=UPI003F6A772A